MFVHVSYRRVHRSYMRQLWDGNGESVDLGIDMESLSEEEGERDDKDGDRNVSTGIGMEESHLSHSHAKNEGENEIGRERQDKDGVEDRGGQVGTGTESGSLRVSNHARSMVEDAYREEGAIEVCRALHRLPDEDTCVHTYTDA